MYFVYVLESETSGRLYIGSTDHLIRRFHEHQRGKTRSTRHHGPWAMPYYEMRPTRAEAVRRERQLKAWKNPVRIRALFPSSWSVPTPRREGHWFESSNAHHPEDQK